MSNRLMPVRIQESKNHTNSEEGKVLKKIFTFALMMMLVLSFALAGCSSSDESSGNSGKDDGKSEGGGGDSSQDTLIYGRGADATRLDPATVTDGESLKVTQQIYETLVNFKPGTTDLEPGLATKWEKKNDGKKYVFDLRKNVKFQDGTDFNADAVVFNFERWQNGSDDDNFAYYPSMFGGFGDESVIKEVKATDDNTVEFDLKTSFAPFLKNLAMTPFAIASPTAVKKEGDQFSKKPVGTGPFKLKEWDKNSKIVLEKNEDYWNSGHPKLSSVIFQVIPDNSSRLNALKNGEIDLMDGVNPTDVKSIESNDQLKVWNRPPLNLGYLGFNVEKKPFDNKKVRQALNHAVDKKSLIDAFYAGNGKEAKNPMPQTIEGFNDDIDAYKFDLDKAKKMLADAGYPDGFDMELWAMNNPRPYLPQPQKIAEAIQSTFGKIGVKVKIKPVEWSTYIEKLTKGESPAFLMGWTGDNGDADNFLYTLLHKDAIDSNNMSRYSNDKVNKILKQAQTEADEDKRMDEYKKAQKMIHEDAPWIPLVYAEEPLAGNANLQDYQPNPTGSEPFDVAYFK